jgi:hypothetical protein
MGELFLVLIPLIQQLTSAAGIGAALHAVTLVQWAEIGMKAVAAGPEVAAALPKVWAALHPALGALKPAFVQFLEDIANGMPPEQAAAALKAQLARNADKAIALQPGIAGQ